MRMDELVIVDLADIDNLKDSEFASRISADFSSVTNAILENSPCYMGFNGIGRHN